MATNKEQMVKKVQEIVASDLKPQRCVLVATYKKKLDQLGWIRKRHLYNYPLSKEEADATGGGWSKVKELWLYSGTKDRRHIYAAEFVGIKARKDFLAEHPDYPKGKGKGHGDYYAVFGVRHKYQPTLDESVVVVRAADFKRTPKVVKAVKDYQAGGELGCLLDYLPAELAPLAHDQLRVCEAAVQQTFLSVLFPEANNLEPRVSLNDTGNRNYTVVDLFSGAGGLSYGFEMVGFDVALAVEKDTWAVNTYKLNHQNQNVIEADISKLDDSFFNPFIGKVDIVMGGPPCQGFSIAASNRRKKDDARNALYKQFLRVVDVLQPKIVLIENVKEIIGYKLPDGTRIVDDIVSSLVSNGYFCDYDILNCSHYGVPQDRRRFFCLAVQKDVAITPYRISSLMERFSSPELSFAEAVSDLPVVCPKEYPEDSILSYTMPATTPYQKQMRARSRAIYNHIPMQHTEKTIKKFEFLLSTHGSLSELPDSLKAHSRGNRNLLSSSTYSQNHRVISKNKCSPTITASFYSSFIHPTQPRNLTVREAARLQSFPDTFIFTGKKTTLSKKLLARKGIVEELHLDQFNQVGNAVPPLMASHLAAICLGFLHGGSK